jgi:hypothetical protein
MSKFDSYIWWANYEAYHGKVQTAGRRSDPGFLRVPSKEELKNYMIAGGASGYDPTVHWCGIFQTYLLLKAGVACHWDRAIVDDSGGRELEVVSGTEAQKGLQCGDIVRVSHAQHHLMVLEPVTKGFIRSIEGNAGGLDHPLIAAYWMGNARHNTVETIQFRYRVIA